LAGVMGYEGHLLTIDDPAKKAARIHAALDLLVDTADQIRRAGLPCPIVSCGGSGSFLYSADHPGITELQAGGAIFMDEFYWDCCQVRHLGFAQTVLATVVSRPTPDRAIIDAGRKTLNQEIHIPRVQGRKGIEVVVLSAEHGQLRLAPDAQQLRIGDRLELIPGYGDLTTVLHDEMYGFRRGRLEVIWPVEGRGKIR
jgi:D-serine deaminase-like pyridoxal phosphate-dependent protein